MPRIDPSKINYDPVLKELMRLNSLYPEGSVVDIETNGIIQPKVARKAKPICRKDVVYGSALYCSAMNSYQVVGVGYIHQIRK